MNENQSGINPINTLFIAVVQAQDAEIAENSLGKLNLPVTRLPSVGGFRRQAQCHLIDWTSH